MRRWLLLAGLLVAAGLAGALMIANAGRGAPEVPGVDWGQPAHPLDDPFAYRPERAEEMAERAAFGVSHSLYRFSPGGAARSAERTARWRPAVEEAAEQAGVDPDRLEGLVLLESAGRPDAITGAGLRGAVGLAQILAETGENLLGMRVDLEQSRELTQRMERARGRGQERVVERLEQRRRRVDERFDPEKSLAGAARYLTLARERFGREDLAFVSYHMGMGNLENLLRDFSGRSGGPIGEVVAEEDLDWARVYFETTPRTHPATQQRLARFGDDSANYFWKVEAGSEIMRLAREDPDELRRMAEVQTAKASAEEVLHPAGSTDRYETPADLRAAWDAGDLRELPDDPAATGLRRSRDMGQLAGRLDQPPRLYRGLRPEALALALYVGAHVRDLAGGGELTVTSTVRDQAYQDLLIGRNVEATRGYSLHTTGWAFDVARSYDSDDQARAFQWVLERLEVLGIIAWVREPGAIHLTVSRDAEVLLPLLDRLEEPS